MKIRLSLIFNIADISPYYIVGRYLGTYIELAQPNNAGESNLGRVGPSAAITRYLVV